MVSDARRRRVHVDGDGVRTEHEPLTNRVLGAPAAMLALVGGATLATLVIMRFTSGGRPGAGTHASPAQRTVATPAAGPGDVAMPVPSIDPSPERVAAPGAGRQSGHVRRRPAPAREEGPSSSSAPELQARDVIPALVASGAKTGIAVFPLPGTDPLKPGIIVPEDFDLPEGFVRHYQTDDNGKRLPPILIVHPDYDLVNERGEIVPLPDGRMVPPELAPAGMPIRMLEVPKPGAADPER